MGENQNREKISGKIRQVLSDPVLLYCILNLIGLLSLGICAIISHGEIWSHFFFNDIRDTGMDFFHSIEYVKYRMPYEQFETVYPPLANLCFYVLFRMIPVSVADNWLSDYHMSIGARGTDADLRTWQAPMVLFLFFILVVAVLLYWIVESQKSEHTAAVMRTFAACSLFSYGVLYCFERGNILLVALILAIIFVRYRNSENPFVRELALLSLAFSAGLKIYPAFLGVLLIRDKKWGAAVRTIIYGVAAIILPFFFFKEGLIGGFTIWVGKLLHFGSSSSTTINLLGTGFVNIVAQLVKLVTGADLPNIAIVARSGYICAAVLLICSLLVKKEWQAVLAQVVAIILIQNQGVYIVCLMLIPLLSFAGEEKKLTGKTVIPFLCTIAMNIPLPYLDTLSIYKHMSQVVLGILLIYILCEAVKSVVFREKTECVKE